MRGRTAFRTGKHHERYGERIRRHRGAQGEAVRRLGARAGARRGTRPCDGGARHRHAAGRGWGSRASEHRDVAGRAHPPPHQRHRLAHPHRTVLAQGGREQLRPQLIERAGPRQPDARFEPYEPAHRLKIVNILGMEEDAVSPGAVLFTRDGREWRLDTVLESPGDKELFIMFADETSGRETYGAGRFLYIPLPEGGRAPLDFNKAYNPPCALNDFATCPLPPPQNRLKLRVEAGEKKYAGGPGHHS